MRHGEEPGILDEQPAVNFNDELLRNSGGSRSLYRRLWRHWLWTCALSLGFQLLLCESHRTCEDVVSQNMFAQVLRRFGMIFARASITSPYVIRAIAVALAGNG